MHNLRYPYQKRATTTPRIEPSNTKIPVVGEQPKVVEVKPPIFEKEKEKNPTLLKRPHQDPPLPEPDIRKKLHTDQTQDLDKDIADLIKENFSVEKKKGLIEGSFKIIISYRIKNKNNF